MKKRILAMFMAAALCVSLVPFSVWADEIETEVFTESDASTVDDVSADDTEQLEKEDSVDTEKDVILEEMNSGEVEEYVGKETFDVSSQTNNSDQESTNNSNSNIKTGRYGDFTIIVNPNSGELTISGEGLLDLGNTTNDIVSAAFNNVFSFSEYVNLESIDTIHDGRESGSADLAYQLTSFAVVTV